MGHPLATEALANGFACVAESEERVAQLCDAIAPEHLQLVVADPGRLALLVNYFGTMFIGQQTPEVLSDHGVGPNHVLPTARSGEPIQSL